MCGFLDCRIALGTALTVLIQEVLGESCDFESLVKTTNIVTVFNLVAKGAHFASQGITIDLGQVAATLVQTGSLERRKCHVIKGTCLTLLLTIAGNAICPVTLPEEFSRLWVEALTHCLEILGGNLSFETQQFSAASVPFAFDSPILVVIIALLEMALCVAFTAGHGTNRQHGSTLALFEIWGQATSWRGG